VKALEARALFRIAVELVDRVLDGACDARVSARKPREMALVDVFVALAFQPPLR
jgi:hypothetical protein